MERSGFIVLALVSFVTASPYGYGAKSGAIAKAEASAAAGAFPPAIPLNIPNGSGFSGSFSKSSSSSFASSSASASSSSSSFSYSGSGTNVIPGLSGCPGACNGAGGKNEVGFTQGSTDGLNSNDNNSASAGAKAVVNGPVNGPCTGTNCNGYDKKCTKANCDVNGNGNNPEKQPAYSSSSENSEQDLNKLSNDYNVNIARKPQQSFQSGLNSKPENGQSADKKTFVQLNTSDKKNNNGNIDEPECESPDCDGFIPHSNDNTQNPNKPSSYLQTPYKENECTTHDCISGNFNSNPGSGKLPSSYNVPILGVDNNNYHKLSQNCNNGQCQPHNGQNPQETITDLSYQTSAQKGPNCASGNCGNPTNQPNVPYNPSFQTFNPTSAAKPTIESHSSKGPHPSHQPSISSYQPSGSTTPQANPSEPGSLAGPNAYPSYQPGSPNRANSYQPTDTANEPNVNPSYRPNGPTSPQINPSFQSNGPNGNHAYHPSGSDNVNSNPSFPPSGQTTTKANSAYHPSGSVAPNSNPSFMSGPSGPSGINGNPAFQPSGSSAPYPNPSFPTSGVTGPYPHPSYQPSGSAETAPSANPASNHPSGPVASHSSPSFLPSGPNSNPHFPTHNLAGYEPNPGRVSNGQTESNGKSSYKPNGSNYAPTKGNNNQDHISGYNKPSKSESDSVLVSSAKGNEIYTGGFGGPSGILSTNNGPHHSNVPKPSQSPNGNPSNVVPTNGHPTPVSFNDKDKPVYTGGFGGPAGLLKPNEHTIPPNVKTPACSSGNCGTNSNGGLVVANAVAKADAVAYSGGFGGPPGLLKAYDGGKIDGKQGLNLNGKHSNGQNDENGNASQSQNTNAVPAGAQANAVASASATAFAGGYGQPGGCNSGCSNNNNNNNTTGHGNNGDKHANNQGGAIANASASARSVAGAYAQGGSVASASAHAAAGIKGGSWR
ncbi:uncharacterized protein DDB_G0283357-like [Zerene cesonia]|uniref:uncharacterized protein DDB_G0283357-like n=1 Tax=Zerene cesonia TaxID=33412 RepID=UPI0018E52E64|nr:uncharacterized protein DDB_G0283357-like [Zerene cesonia]